MVSSKIKRHSKIVLKVIGILFLLVLFITPAFAQGIPKIMHHASRLIDPGTGDPYPPGKYYIRFVIVNPVTKQVLWQYSLWMSIAPDNPEAEYEILLGKYNPIDLPFDEGYVLRVIELTGGPPGTIVENRALSSVGYAYRSEFTNYADTVFDSSDNVYKHVEDIKIYEADNADTVDGKDASEFGDTHSLDAADGDPVDVVYVDNAGNVGIRTTSPIEELTIASEVPMIVFDDNVGPNIQRWYIGEGGSLNEGDFVIELDYDSDGSIDDTALYIEEANRNIGIGTTRPLEKLHIFGGNLLISAEGSDSYIHLKSDELLDATDAYIWCKDSVGLAFGSTAGTPDVVMTSLGNVGIGTVNPKGYKLIVDAQKGIENAIYGFHGGDGVGVWGSSSTGEGLHGSSTSGKGVYGSTTSGYAGYFYGKTVVMNGNVGIGTASPGEKLQITSGTTHFLIAPGELDNVVNADWVTLDIPGTKNLRIWDNLSISGRVGIGTVSPNQELHIKGTSHTDVKIEAQDNYNAGIILNEAANLRWLIYNDADEEDRFRISNGSYDLVTVEQNGNVGIGTSNPGNKLDVLGTIRAEEVIVETGWADYVFEEGYIRMGLDELESYIRKRGHLPEIPTEEEVKENGVGIGAFQVKLLQKIEELTLYIIDQKKEIDLLKKEIAQLNMQSAGGVDIHTEGHVKNRQIKRP